MASPFSDAVSTLSDARKAAFGGVLRFIPVIFKQYGKAPLDPDRPPFEVAQGSFTEVHNPMARLKIRESVVSRDFDHKIIAPMIYASVDNRDLAVGYSIKVHDRIKRIGVAGEPEYEITAIEPDGEARKRFVLAAIVEPAS